MAKGCWVALLAALMTGGVMAGGKPKEPTGRIKVRRCLRGRGVDELENRSFDHLLGWWGRTREGVDAIPDSALNIVNKTNTVIKALPNAPFIQRNPCGELNYVTKSVYGTYENIMSPKTAPTMSGFVDVVADCWGTTSVEELQTIMSGFTPTTAPVTAALASEFAVFDRWFASVPAETIPNRLFLASGTSNGFHTNDVNADLQGFSQQSIYASLSDHKISWKNYFGMIPTALLFQDVRNFGDIVTKIRPLSKFFKHAKEGTLPQVSFLDPVWGRSADLPDGLGGPPNDNHPPHDLARGEKLVKDVYEAIRASPLWEETLLLITYDEHGGFYDPTPTDVPPPVNVPVPDAASAASPVFKFDRLGIRVPTKC
ncbi:hypothetical protein HDU67_009601 [Dinochytrium kinnereticum]|nr:hypothetical protein HDU67_009601 [Dinochytrium kinnereticum]